MGDFVKSDINNIYFYGDLGAPSQVYTLPAQTGCVTQGQFWSGVKLVWIQFSFS